MGRQKTLEGRSISARLSGDLENRFDVERALHVRMSDACLTRELIDEALRARAALRA